MLITGAAPPGGGRSEVTPRFVRHFNVFCVPQASTSAMQLIFSSTLKVRHLFCFLTKYERKLRYNSFSLLYSVDLVQVGYRENIFVSFWHDPLVDTRLSLKTCLLRRHYDRNK